MRITYTVDILDTDAAWRKLAEVLGDGHPAAVESTIRHLRILDVKSYVLEGPYIDRDYSADYLSFYARTFRAPARHCKRAHFFSDDISSQFRQPRSTAQFDQLRQSYCGFCVIRPLPQAPIGRTVLLARVRDHEDIEGTVTCRAEFEANLQGMDFTVRGTAYLQQDTRVGACAQIAIWAGLRHLHARHGYNWASVADITRLANPTSSFDEATTLPAGSKFLTHHRMLQAISEAGCQPLCFSEQDIAAAILPYVESGIPVILGLKMGDSEVGHAVTVIGRVFAKQNQPTENAAQYVPAYVVHDDQGGPYMLLPVSTPHPFDDDTIKRTTPDGPVELNMDDVFIAVALMSPRVFSTAADAEASAHDSINDTLNSLPNILKKRVDPEEPVNTQLLDELQMANAEHNIVLRTYLTSAAGYRRHLANSTACDDLKCALLGLQLPHFTWVTEIATIDSYNHASVRDRRIYGHTIIDATSTGRDGDGFMGLHLPGLLFTKKIDAQGKEQDEYGIINSDRPYECRSKDG